MCRLSQTVCTRRSRLRVSGHWARAAAVGARRSRVRLRSSASAPTTSRWCRSTTPRPLANDPNETELHERLADSLGRSAGAPLFVVSQKSLTGHSKGGAAVFQMMGMCQMLRDGVLPPNRSLDCVDDELAGAQHLVWLRDSLKFGDKFPLKAGLITSLGFGHVSGVIALVHPQAFMAALGPDQRGLPGRRSRL